MMDKNKNKLEHTEETEIGKYTEEYYLTRCGGFDKYRMNQFKPIYAKILNYLDVPKKSVLDLGCGRGEATVILAQSGYQHIDAVDFSASSLKLTKQTLENFCTAEEIGRVSYIQANANSIPKPDGSYNAIIQLDIIEHLPQKDIDLMLKETERLLKPGGMLLLHTSPNIIIINFFTALAKFFFGLKERSLENKVHISMQSAKSLGENLRKTALTFEIKRRIQHNFLFEKLTVVQGYDPNKFKYKILGTIARISDLLWLILFTPFLYVPGIRDLICNNFVVIAQKEKY